MGSAFFILLYFLAIYFQAIKGASPLKSGIMTLPTLLGLTIGMTIAAHTHKYVQYHAVFMIASAVLSSIGCGLVSTFGPRTDHEMWIGYQALFGIGQGIGWQQPLLIAQTFLEAKDIPIGTAMMSGWKLLGGATFISVGSTVFNNFLTQALLKIEGLDVEDVLKAGATELRSRVDERLLPRVVDAYAGALRTVFHVSVVLSCAAVLGAAFVEWKRDPRAAKQSAEKESKNKGKGKNVTGGAKP